MKKTKFFRYAVLALASICALTLAGCPTDPDPEPDPALVDSWTNATGEGSIHGGLLKTFSIDSNFKFEAKINPMFIGAYNDAYFKALPGGAEAANIAGLAALAYLEQQPGVTEANTRWTVTGKLTADGGAIYVMSSLEEKTGKMTPPKPDADPEAPLVSADVTVRGFNGQRVRITFNEGKNAFSFVSAENNDEVTAFFGGDYTKVSP